jgi:hypothetical protein
MSKEAPARSAMKRTVDKIKSTFWEGYLPEPDKRQQALDKKAENARELGLMPYNGGDYEPAPATELREQEPVAYIHRQGNHYEVSERFLSDDEKSRGWTEEPLYTSPPAQRTWEEWFKWWRISKVADSTEAEIDFADFMLIVRAVESEYGIKENT